jgi:hypothetical protein
MKEAINQFLKEFADEVYDMPEHHLELLMDNHICISWNGKEYFVPENNSCFSEDDNLIWEFLNTCYHV